MKSRLSEFWAGLALVALAIIGLTAWAQDEPVEPPNPARESFVAAVDLGGKAFNVAFDQALDASTSPTLTAAQKYGLVKERDLLLMNAGARNIKWAWANASAACKAAFRESAKRIWQAKKAASEAVIAQDQAAIDDAAKPEPTPTPTPTP